MDISIMPGTSFFILSESDTRLFSRALSSVSRSFGILTKKFNSKGTLMQGLTIRIQENKCHYCISGSVSLDDLYKLCEHHQVDLDSTSKK